LPVCKNEPSQRNFAWKFCMEACVEAGTDEAADGCKKKKQEVL
jgi:hypothetical protein